MGNTRARTFSALARIARGSFPFGEGAGPEAFFVDDIASLAEARSLSRLAAPNLTRLGVERTLSDLPRALRRKFDCAARASRSPLPLSICCHATQFRELNRRSGTTRVFSGLCDKTLNI
jgi:hypothetical protein